MRFFFLILFILPILTMGQTHLKGQHYVYVETGAYDSPLPGNDNYSIRLGLGKYSGKAKGNVLFFGFAHKMTQAVAEQGIGAGISVPVNQYYIGFQSELNLLQNASKTFTVKLLGSLTVGYESLNHNNRNISGYRLEQSSTVLLGIAAGAEIEYRSFMVGFRQGLNLTGNYQKFSSYPYVGLKIHLME